MIMLPFMILKTLWPIPDFSFMRKDFSVSRGALSGTGVHRAAVGTPGDPAPGHGAGVEPRSGSTPAELRIRWRSAVGATEEVAGDSSDAAGGPGVAGVTPAVAIAGIAGAGGGRARRAARAGGGRRAARVGRRAARAGRRLRLHEERHLEALRLRGPLLRALAPYRARRDAL